MSAEQEIIILRSYLQEVENRFFKLQNEFKNIVAQNTALTKQLTQKDEQIKRLTQELEKYKHHKDSNNSSTPPSQDQNRAKRNQSFKIKSGKKPGGQQGHEGNTLKMTLSPDKYVHHIPTCCTRCGKDLMDQPVLISRRQVIDVPPINTITTEHQIYSRICSCGHCSTGEFAQEATNNVSYGPQVSALISYLSVRQYMSTNRIQEYFEQFYNLHISEGTICNKLKDMATRLQVVYDKIRDNLSRCTTYVGSDETGCKINGNKGWMWTWQNETNTYITPSEHRKASTICDHFIYGFPYATLLHDCWKSQINTTAKYHQLCLPHLIRELNFFIELDKEKWSTMFKSLLQKAIKLKPTLDYRQDNSFEISTIERECKKLLDQPIDIDNAKLKAFHKRMNKLSGYLFTFLHHEHVPHDNNSSERAIRNIKVKQKSLVNSKPWKELHILPLSGLLLILVLKIQWMFSPL
ncbi:MAG TPA: IS66 family transposase [Saprospiraceae bacterium]|nr:IS66 family transposase [Saprospiraceae bacterium]